MPVPFLFYYHSIRSNSRQDFPVFFQIIFLFPKIIRNLTPFHVFLIIFGTLQHHRYRIRHLHPVRGHPASVGVHLHACFCRLL